jgi:pantoate kinase
LPKSASAFAPAAISSFFEICDQTRTGKPITDLTRVGARGGGFGLQKGVLTDVSASESRVEKIQVYVNGHPAPEAKTTETTIHMLLSKTQGKYQVIVNHKIKVPISAGFGTSAGGALSAGLSLKEALGLPLTNNQVGVAAHVAEIQCQTGFGTVSSLAQGGGCILVVEPGAPGVCVVDSIPLKPEYEVVAGVFRSIPKSTVFSSAEKRLEINRFGRKTLDRILAEPTLENFLACCWQFALETGLATSRVKNLVNLAQKTGAVGAAQNMVGEAVHAVVFEENAVNVEEAFKQVMPRENVFKSKLDFQGARLTTRE